MARSRNKTADDWRRYKKFEKENEQLRKEVTKLRKTLNSVLLDHLEEKAKRVQVEASSQVAICEICGNDNIQKMTITRLDGAFEIKLCKSCGHRSALSKIKSDARS